ncbi:hypothetical protein AB0H00_19630 [Nocardia sp. NPDC023852]|uniref:hypothetical protein n=1 Tax=Nocardia sp. NPDC023852 TaxID=3154697 RepID=UPI00340173D3
MRSCARPTAHRAGSAPLILPFEQAVLRFEERTVTPAEVVSAVATLLPTTFDVTTEVLLGARCPGSQAGTALHLPSMCWPWWCTTSPVPVR